MIIFGIDPGVSGAISVMENKKVSKTFKIVLLIVFIILVTVTMVYGA